MRERTRGERREKERGEVTEDKEMQNEGWRGKRKEKEREREGKSGIG